MRIEVAIVIAGTFGPEMAPLTPTTQQSEVRISAEQMYVVGIPVITFRITVAESTIRTVFHHTNSACNQKSN